MISKIQCFLIFIYSLLLVCAIHLSYLYGKSKAKVEIVEKQREVIKYETKEVCKIMAKSNLNDDDISRLLESGIL